MKNIEGVINSDLNLTIFSRGIVAAELKKAWGSEGPFTVFAPSDLAFSKLDAGVFPDLEKADNRLKMEVLMNDYAVRGKIVFNDMKDGQKLSTISGKQLNISVNNNTVLVNGATIQGRDMLAWNGVVHSIDKLIGI